MSARRSRQGAVEATMDLGTGSFSAAPVDVVATCAKHS